MGNFKTKLAANIRALRGDKTQTDFAKKLAITQSSLNRIEQGVQNVTLDTLQKICTRLKCKPSDLLE